MQPQQRRLGVLERQLTAAAEGAVAEPALLPQSSTNPDALCPLALNAVLVHDNAALRQDIYDFLKVGVS
jgi:hypothetical protein